MGRRNDGQPTPAELEILQVLWDRGWSTVREVHELMPDKGSTTVLKFMQIMTDKGLLEKDDSVRPQRFRAVQSRRDTQRGLLSDLVERVFRGSTGALVLQALPLQETTAEERAEIRRLLDAMESDGDTEVRS